MWPVETSPETAHNFLLVDAVRRNGFDGVDHGAAGGLPLCPGLCEGVRVQVLLLLKKGPVRRAQFWQFGGWGRRIRGGNCAGEVQCEAAVAGACFKDFEARSGVTSG